MHASREAEPARLDEDDVSEVLLRVWAQSLAHGADRAEVRKLAGGLLVVLDEAEHLRRAGRGAMIPAQVRDMLTDALRKRGHEPPA